MVMTSNINYETHTCLAFKGQVPLVEGLKNPTFENKRCALELLQVEVTVTHGKARVKSIVTTPKGAVEFDLKTPSSLT